MRGARFHSIVALLALAMLSPGTECRAAPTIHVEERERIVLTVRTMDPDLADSSASGEVPATGRLSLPLQVRWPDLQNARRVSLEAQRRLTPAGQRILLNATLPISDPASPIRASREIVVEDESTTALFEIARAGESVLTLIVTVERSTEASYSVQPVVGRPVEFAVSIEWVDNGHPVTLETNHLQTFVGQSVSYAFKLGETGLAESMEMRLLPVDLVGETLRVDASVSGTIPDGEEGVELLSRREQWFCSRGTTSTLSATRGTPASGFRFQVTPRF